MLSILLLLISFFGPSFASYDSTGKKRYFCSIYDTTLRLWSWVVIGVHCQNAVICCEKQRNIQELIKQLCETHHTFSKYCRYDVKEFERIPTKPCWSKHYCWWEGDCESLKLLCESHIQPWNWRKCQFQVQVSIPCPNRPQVWETHFKNETYTPNF